MAGVVKEKCLVTLSVVVPAFNCQDTIEECLRSIRQSTYSHYELIVADDGSSDRTASIARAYADKLVLLPHGGRVSARKNGLKVAEGQILVNIDSDILVAADTLARISRFFEVHPHVDALTGCLSKCTPDPGFFSQYKNLYMHYIFSQLPERVTFLYGSIYAFRVGSHDFHLTLKKAHVGVKIADDTALGQSFAAAGKPIAFLKDLQVTHLKGFNLFSFLKNDFAIPFDWAKIFFRNRGWTQIGKHGTGFCHAPKEQLLSVILVPLLLTLLILVFLGRIPVCVPFFGIPLWFLLNMRFLAFLAREKRVIFGLQSIPVTFFDHLVMAAGIACGSISFMLGLIRREKVPS